jgi:actin-like protein 6A
MEDLTTHASGSVSSTIGGASAAAASSSSSSAAVAQAASKRSTKSYFTGRSQLFRRDHMKITHPLRHGLVQDWDGVEQVWSYAFDQHLKVDPKEHPLMLSEPTFQPTADREKMVQLMFEKFQPPAVFLCKSSVLTAFSAGRSTACVVESGAGHTTVSPIHDGYVVSKGVRRSQMGGLKLDETLEKILAQQDPTRVITPAYLLNRKVDAEGHLHIQHLTYPHTHPSYHALMVNDLYRDMKESLCRLGESAFDSHQKFPTVQYELPDGNTLEVGNERFIVPEHIFNPRYGGLGLLDLKHDFDGAMYKGLHHMVLESVEAVDVDLRKELYGNVVLSGGNTLFPGTPNRLTKEVGGILSAAHKVSHPSHCRTRTSAHATRRTSTSHSSTRHRRASKAASRRAQALNERVRVKEIMQADASSVRLAST